MEQQMTHEQAIDLLRDIQGMDASWWQALLAWLGFYGGIAAAVGVVGYFGYRYWRKKMQRRKIWSMAGMLEEIKASVLAPKEKISALNDWLRRMAIMRHGREVAGISGHDWLGWLDDNAGKQDNFSWRQQGMMLLEMPYAPPTAIMDETAWEQMIVSSELWLKDAEGSK